MAYLITSSEVHIGDGVSTNLDPITFPDSRSIGVLPTLYDHQWHFVEPVNHWFVHLKAEKYLEDISSYARAMKHYWSFLESNTLSWNFFPPAKSLKPTYRYRNDRLLKCAKAGELAYSTANTYMSHVVQFYLWAAYERYYTISENHKPFEIEFVRVQRNDILAHMMPKFMVQTTDLRIRVPRDSGTQNIRGLKPLSEEMLMYLSSYLEKTSCEIRLICLLGAQCGLRIEEATGFTLLALDQVVRREGSRTHYEITIGPNSGVPTKYNKTRTIEITEHLLSQLQNYAISERRMLRLEKYLHHADQHNEKAQSRNYTYKRPTSGKQKFLSESLSAVDKYEPLFISQQGSPYRPNTVSARFSEIRRSMKSSGIPFNHKFHDLRCSYATYRLHSLLEAGIEPADALSLLMGWMGHKHEATTWKYLRYLKRKEALKEKISMLDDIMHRAMEGSADE